MEYSVLVLPNIRTMRPELLAKLERLVADGLTILGPAPEKSPSLAGWPLADLKVKEIASKMWRTTEEPFATCFDYGKGKVYGSGSLESIFAEKGITADFVADDPTLPIQFIHLTQEDADIYFVSNQGEEPISFDGIFRVKGKAPELWNPLTAEIRSLPEFKFLSNIIGKTKSSKIKNQML